MKIVANLDLDMVALESEDTVTVMSDLAAPKLETDASRSPGAVIVVLDRSGAMSGDRL